MAAGLVPDRLAKHDAQNRAAAGCFPGVEASGLKARESVTLLLELCAFTEGISPAEWRGHGGRRDLVPAALPAGHVRRTAGGAQLPFLGVVKARGVPRKANAQGVRRGARHNAVGKTAWNAQYCRVRDRDQCD